MTAEERIVMVARELFLNHGYESVSLRDIAKEADVAPSAISYYFGSKQELYEELFPDKAAEEPTSVQEKIEYAALSLFADMGYERVTIRDISRKAGVNSASISYYFGGKMNLYMTILRVGAERIKERLERQKCHFRNPQDVIHYHIQALGELLVMYPEAIRIMQWELVNPTEPFKEIWNTLYRPLFSDIYCALEEGISRGIFRKEINPRCACILFINMIFNFFTIKGNQMIDGIMGAEGSISQEDYFKEVEDLVMNGILIAEDGGMKRKQLQKQVHLFWPECSS